MIRTRPDASRTANALAGVCHAPVLTPIKDEGTDIHLPAVALTLLRYDFGVEGRAVDIDVEKTKDNRMKFLAALYEIASEHLETNQAVGGIICIREGMWVIGERAGLTRRETDDVGTALSESNFVIVQSATSDRGPTFCLTQEGCEIARTYLYEKSPLAKRRKLVAAIKEKSATGAVSILKEAGKWLGGILIGVIGASYGPALTKLVKEFFRIN
jgi:hypothetical protein